MAAVTTKKPGGDAAVQLTFPTVFEYTAAAEHIPMMMFGMTPPARHVPSASLDDVQEAYHEQKCLDANRMVMAKVQSTQSARNYYVKSHQGYIVPPPVLSQRKFANPSNGAAGIGGDLFPARRTAAAAAAPFMCSGNGLHGGVLRTAEGQKWGATRLQDRVSQLNTIDAELAAFETGQVMDSLPLPTAVEQGLPSQQVNLLVEFNTYRQALTDALISGTLDRFALTDFARMLSILFRIAPTANREELEDMKSGSETMMQLMSGVAEQAREGYDLGRRGQHAPQVRRFIANVVSLVEKTNQYINKMLSGVDLQYKERLALSKNLVRSLGFTKLLNTLEFRAPPTPAQAAAAASAPDADDDDDEDDDEGGDHFTREAPTREDSEAPPRGRFDRDQRQVFGTRSGAFEGEQLSAADLPSSTAENAARRPRDNRMAVAAYAQTPVRPAFADVGEGDGYDDFTGTPPLLRAPAASAAAAADAAPPVAAAASTSERTTYNTLTPAEKLAAIRLAADSGLDLNAARRALNASFATKTWDKAREKKPSAAAIAVARSKYPQFAAPAAAAAAAAPSVRTGVPIKIGDKGVFMTGTPEYTAAMRAFAAEGKAAYDAAKGKGRGRPRKMTPAIHAQKKLGKPRGGIRKKKALSLE
jgi:hypothetical protein